MLSLMFGTDAPWQTPGRCDWRTEIVLPLHSAPLCLSLIPALTLSLFMCQHGPDPTACALTVTLLWILPCDWHIVICVPSHSTVQVNPHRTLDKPLCFGAYIRNTEKIGDCETEPLLKDLNPSLQAPSSFHFISNSRQCLCKNKGHVNTKRWVIR